MIQYWVSMYVHIGILARRSWRYALTANALTTRIHSDVQGDSSKYFNNTLTWRKHKYRNIHYQPQALQFLATTGYHSWLIPATINFSIDYYQCKKSLAKSSTVDRAFISEFTKRKQIGKSTEMQHYLSIIKSRFVNRVCVNGLNNFIIHITWRPSHDDDL